MSKKGIQHPFDFGKSLRVIKPVIPEENLEKTCQFTDILKKCDTPEDYQRYLLYHCKSANQRWVEAYTKLTDDDPNVPWKTVKKGIISDVFELTDPEERKDFVEREFGNNKFELFEGRYKSIYELYFQDKTKEQFSSTAVSIGRLASSRIDGLGSFTRNTVNFWLEGSMPQDRDIVIKLSFWAKCTVEETNKLLELAGMHKLYLKGTGNIKSTRSSLQDIVYIFMLQNKNYSFSTAQEVITSLNSKLKEEIKKEMTIDVDDADTKIMTDLFNELSSDKKELEDYFKTNISKLLYNYRSLYGLIVQSFENKYAISKGNQANPAYSSIRAFTVSRLETKIKQELKANINEIYSKKNEKERKSSVDGRWRESLKNTLYSAFNANAEIDQKLSKKLDPNDYNIKIQKTFTEKQMKRIFQRNDIIVLGLIENRSDEGMTKLLQSAQESPLYAKNFIEAVIIRAVSEPRVYFPLTKMINLLYTNMHYEQYGLTKEELLDATRSYLHFYEHPNYYNDELKKLSAGINAMLSLRRYEWIKSVSVVKEMYPWKEQTVLKFQYLPENVKEKKASKNTFKVGSVFVIKFQFRHAIKKKREILRERENTLKNDKISLNIEEKLLKKAVRDGNEKLITCHTNRIKKLNNFIENIDLDPKHIPEPSKATEKILYLKKLQVVRPIAYRYSKELLSYYPEKTLFDFWVEKTSSYLKNKELCYYLKKER